MVDIKNVRVLLLVVMSLLAALSFGQETGLTPPTSVAYQGWATTIAEGFTDVVVAIMPICAVLLGIMVGPRILKKLVKSFSH